MKIAIIAFMLAGCSFGVGSSYVGQWKPKHQVDFEACLVDETGKCIDKKQVTSEVPGRKFWGVILAFPALGASSVTYKGETGTEIRGEPSLEILKGSGRWAFGIRANVLIDEKTGMGTDGMPKPGGVISFPVDAIGHVAIVDRLSLYGGVGLSPYSTIDDEHTFVAGRGLVGLQFPISKTHSENFIIFSFEVDRMYIQFDQPYHATGYTGHIGLFF